ncbi:peptidase inhibitor family I36 protein [Amycolatopsis magusensis]|uniref:peptidase inhibitor family I36 protein n=1 Tax=Amycolatopsis magusensis TaxID=882444 RepID=UPI0037B9A079
MSTVIRRTPARRRGVRKAAVFFSLLAVGFAGNVPAAQADQARGHKAAAVAGAPLCDPGYLCVWSLPHFDGTRYRVTATPSGSCKFPAPLGFRSAFNRTGFTQRLWQYSTCTGVTTLIANGVAFGDHGHRYSVGGP